MGQTPPALTEREAALLRGEDPALVTVNPPVIPVTLANYRDEWQRLADAGADLVLIDTPARLDSWAMQAAELSDLAIVPSKPTVKDLERVEASIRLASMPRPAPDLRAAQPDPAPGRSHRSGPPLHRRQEIPRLPRHFRPPLNPFEDADTPAAPRRKPNRPAARHTKSPSSTLSPPNSSLNSTPRSSPMHPKKQKSPQRWLTTTTRRP